MAPNSYVLLESFHRYNNHVKTPAGQASATCCRIILWWTFPNTGALDLSGLGRTAHPKRVSFARPSFIWIIVLPLLTASTHSHKIRCGFGGPTRPAGFKSGNLQAGPHFHPIIVLVIQRYESNVWPLYLNPQHMRHGWSLPFTEYIWNRTNNSFRWI